MSEENIGSTGLAVTPEIRGTLAGFENTGTTIGDLIKPLKTEIHLFDTFVAGVATCRNLEVLSSLSVGDVLTLRREASKFDDNEISLYAKATQSGADVKVGRIPEKDNVIFARLLEAGKCLEAKVSAVSQLGSIKEIKIGIYLIDF